ncbi:hypothetical protein AB9K17_23875, partial [Salmonella enterica subsp. enterica serovar Kentucky]
HEAAKAGCADVVRELIKAGADLTNASHTCSAYTCIYSTCSYKNIKNLKR